MMLYDNSDVVGVFLCEILPGRMIRKRDSLQIISLLFYINILTQSYHITPHHSISQKNKATLITVEHKGPHRQEWYPPFQ